ncbi:MAG: hypothetical protein WCP52_04515 [Bacteroidota bacterium]
MKIFKCTCQITDAKGLRHAKRFNVQETGRKIRDIVSKALMKDRRLRADVDSGCRVVVVFNPDTLELPSPADKETKKRIKFLEAKNLEKDEVSCCLELWNGTSPNDLPKKLFFTLKKVKRLELSYREKLGCSSVEQVIFLLQRQ